MKEQKFPIYKFSAKWVQDGKQDPKYPNHHKGLPKGRIFNSTAFSKMYKEEKTSNELYKIITDWWDKYSGKSEKIKNPDKCVLTAILSEHETWCIGWFSHHTFDIGQTDEEALLSFTYFVDRKVMLGEDKYCLMGAEDRWRWHGVLDEKTEEKTEAPCRCDGCKKNGVIRICH